MTTPMVVISTIALFLVGGNVAIVLMHMMSRGRRPPEASWGGEAGHAHEASERVWRSGRPTPTTYRRAAEAGVRTVIDLRAEGGDGPEPELGLRVVKLPIRDGQAPSLQALETFMETVDRAEGTVLVHCSAGVGRTGSMVAAWQVSRDNVPPQVALDFMLSVGPPSLEQIDFVIGLPRRLRPRRVVVALSRLLDAPRRTWSRLKSLR